MTCDCADLGATVPWRSDHVRSFFFQLHHQSVQTTNSHLLYFNRSRSQRNAVEMQRVLYNRVYSVQS